MSESQGGGAILYFVNGISLIQTITPDALLGRVNASRRFAVWGVIPAGQLLAGVIAARFGIHAAVWAGGEGGVTAIGGELGIADVQGYTRFTVERGDEAAAALAALFAVLTRDVASRHEGQVLELRGDEALAVFTSARQALRAALALQAAFARETARNPAAPLRVGIGLDSGKPVPLSAPDGPGGRLRCPRSRGSSGCADMQPFRERTERALYALL